MGEEVGGAEEGEGGDAEAVGDAEQHQGLREGADEGAGATALVWQLMDFENEGKLSCRAPRSQFVGWG